MKKSALIALIILFQPLFTLTSFAKDAELQHIPLQVPKAEKNYKEGEVIVKYKNKESKEKEIQNIKNKKLEESKDTANVRIKKEFSDLNALLITSATKKTEELIKEYESNDSIEYAEPNYIRTYTYTPNDPYFSYQWALDLDDDDTDTDIDATDAWDIEKSSAEEIVVAIIDSGVQHSFEELEDNMWDGGSSYPNHGWDFVDNDNDPDDSSYPDDESFQGHGTFIASIIAAETDNSSGMAGLSRYNNVKIMALRFDLDTASEIAAIEFAEENGAKVINASFAGSSYSQLEKDAIDNFSGIFVAASGNGGSDGIGDDNDSSPLYPCNYTSSNIICTGAYYTDGELTSFSNYGTTSVDIAAPGEEILGYSYGCTEYDASGENCTGLWTWGYWLGGGTSYAAPFVTGTAGILYAHKPSASKSTIKSTILNSSETYDSFNGKIASGRKLNLHNALNQITSTKKAIYRFWSSKYNGHFYTASEEERDLVIEKYDDHIWDYEGIAYYTPISSSEGTKPVYRFWSSKYNGHFYTASEEERDLVIEKYDDHIWDYEGIAWYANSSNTSNTKPVYRFWSEKYNHHFYTASEEERDLVIEKYDDYIWDYEGIAWYAIN